MATILRKSTESICRRFILLAILTAAIYGCGGGGTGDAPFNAQGQYIGRISGYDITNQPVTGNITMFVGSNGTGTLVVYDADNHLTASLTGTVRGTSGEFADPTGSVRFIANFSQSAYGQSALIPTATGAWQNTFNGSYGTWSTQLPVVGPILDSSQSPVNLFNLGVNSQTFPSRMVCPIDHFVPPNGLYGCITADGRSFAFRVEPALDSNGQSIRDVDGHQLHFVSCRRLGTDYICVANWTGPHLTIFDMWPTSNGGSGSSTGGGG